MDISPVGSLTTALSSAQASDAASLLVLKKAIDLQAEAASQLLAAVPSLANNPPHLGNSVNIMV